MKQKKQQQLSNAYYVLLQLAYESKMNIQVGKYLVKDNKVIFETIKHETK